MWIAIYSDGSQLAQNNEDGSENLFSNIDQTRLEKFIVRNRIREVIVDIKTGECKVDGLKLAFGHDDVEHRLIYFRRVRQTLGKSSGPQQIEYVGWQATIQGGVEPLNIKRIIGIKEDKITIQCD